MRHKFFYEMTSEGCNAERHHSGQVSPTTNHSDEVSESWFEELSISFELNDCSNTFYLFLEQFRKRLHI